MTIYALLCSQCGLLGGHEPGCPADDGQPMFEFREDPAEGTTEDATEEGTP